MTLGVSGTTIAPAPPSHSLLLAIPTAPKARDCPRAVFRVMGVANGAIPSVMPTCRKYLAAIRSGPQPASTMDLMGP
eukprot:9016937-Pyramimonas_sp.AAC.1